MANENQPSLIPSPPVNCLPKKPLFGLGDASNAPVLDYNMEVRSCLDANVMLPIKIPREYIKAEWWVKPVSNVWDTIKDMTWEQIISEVQSVLSGVPGQYDIFLNSHLLDGTNVHWDFEETENTEKPDTGGLPVFSGGNVTVKGGLVGGSGSVTVKGGAVGGGTVKGGAVTGGATVKGGLNSLTLKDGDLLAIATNINNGIVPMITSNLYGVLHIEWLKEPKVPNPTLYIVNHLKVCTYAGNYGAGKTVHTHSLYPLEKTTATIRTYTEIEKIKSRAENVLDSFSESSADSLEKIIEKESTRVKSDVTSHEFAWKVGGKLGLTFPIEVVDVEVGVDGNVGAKNTLSNSLTKTVRKLTHSIDKHSSESASSRKVEVNTTTSTRVLTENEETTTRIIENINKTCTLNFVFRQLHQEYMSLTYLNEVTFMFTNGYPETLATSEIENLMGLLIQICNTEAQAKEIHDKIMMELCNVIDYQHQPQAFIECRNLPMNACCVDCMDNPPVIVQKWISKKRNLSQTVAGITVPGIILDLTKRIMPTNSVICEALLGQGEALDCYNMQLQGAAVENAKLQNELLRLENARLQQAMDSLEMIVAPLERADAYKKIFGNCCDTPQSGCCCGSCQDKNEHNTGGGEVINPNDSPQ